MMEEIESTEERGLDHLDKFKKIMSDLLNDVKDHFEVRELARTLSVDLSGTTSFSRQKSVLLKFVLQQILKYQPSNQPYYQRLLQETERAIGVLHTSKYVCCLVGCLFTAEKHRSYVQHLKTVHHTHDRLMCNFMHKCYRQFKSINALLDHIKQSHSKEGKEVESQVVQDIECRCDLSSCHGRKFRSVSLLMTHLNTTHAQEQRSCIFDKCSTRFAAGSNSRNHFRFKHKQPGFLKLKEIHIVNILLKSNENTMLIESAPEDLVDAADAESVLQDDLYEENDTFEDDRNTCEGADSEETSNFFMMQYADFLNRLTHLKYIPQRSVTEIANEYRSNYEKAQHVREKKLRQSLLQVPGITEKQIDTIIEESIGGDDYMKAQNELNTEYKRKKFVMQNFKYVAPVEICLNENEMKQGALKEVLHYIPVKESLKTLLEDRSLNQVFEQEREKSRKDDGVLRDFGDGSVFRESEFFKNNPGAYAGHFYSDAVELSNPLGAAKGRHKICQVFYTISQIPKNQRSQIDRIQLCLVVKENLVKKYGYKVIFKDLLQDLKDLEIGITVNKPTERLVQMGLLAYSADNLEAHALGNNKSKLFSEF